MKTRKEYVECLNNIAADHTSSEYKCLLFMIDEFYELKQERVDLLSHVRKRCKKIVRENNKYSVAQWMHWLLGPYYSGKNGDSAYGR